MRLRLSGQGPQLYNSAEGLIMTTRNPEFTSAMLRSLFNSFLEKAPYPSIPMSCKQPHSKETPQILSLSNFSVF